MIETWKHLNVYSPDTFPDCFKLCERPIRATTGRHPFQLYKPLASDGINGVHANSFYYRIVDLWNRLPGEVVSAQTLNTFKKRLDTHWKHDPLKYDYSALWDANYDQEG